MTPKKRSFRPGFEVLEDRCVPATITVTKLTDGIGVPGMTLREAVLKSNSTPATDTIVFKSGLKGTIALGSQIDITDDVTIHGSGAKLLKISGQGVTRIFKIDDGDPGSSPMKVTVRGVTLTGGAAAGSGGAILNGNDDVTLRECTFRGNVASADGGAYSGDQANLIIRDCRFIGNRADKTGGAVRTIGTLQLRNSQFSGNQAHNRGGAMLVNLASGSIVGCDFTGNQTLAGDGGGLWSNGGATLIRRCTIANNTSAKDGGGIHLGGGVAMILDTTISGNRAKQGGGISSNAVTTLTLRNSTISGNAASGDGGGLNIRAGADPHVLQLSTIARNTAARGGGIFADSPVALTSTIVAGNFASMGGQDLSAEDAGDIISAAFCLFQNNDSAYSIILETAPGSNIFGLDPKLGLLKNNGGPTQTHALFKASPAINKGVNTSPAEKFDQRGPTFKRVKGGRIDIGAFER